MKCCKKVKLFVWLLLALVCFKKAKAQDTSVMKALQLPAEYINVVNKKMTVFNKHTQKYTQTSIDKLIMQEKKMQKKVAKVDVLLSKSLFQYSIDSLQKVKAIFKNKSERVTKYLKGSYFPYLDTLKNSLSFLNQTKSVSDGVTKIKGQVSQSLQLMESAESNLDKIENFKNLIDQRRKVLQEQLNRFPQLTGNIKKISKEAYYYSTKISEYKSTLKDPAKIEKEVMNLVRKIPAFQDLLQKNSQLSGMFASAGSFSNLLPTSSIPVVNGLPGRASLQQFLQQMLPSAANFNAVQVMQQQLPEATSQLDKLKNKVNDMGGMGNKTMPDYKPNTQHTKSFKDRLEYGTDFQFSKSVSYMPATSSIALKLGYKLNDKSTIGVGGNYIMGLGQGLKHIRLSNEGLGLRSYVKWKLNKSLDIQGGSEWNYMLQFIKVEELKNINVWQQNALIGISKNYVVGKKLKGNIQILYDALHNRHLPNTQPVVVRFGYGR